MLLKLLNADLDAFLKVTSNLENLDLLSLCKASPQFNSVISSETLRLWKIASFVPSQKTFVLPTIEMPAAFVADDEVVGVAVGPNVAFFSISSGLQVSQVTIPGMHTFGQYIHKMCLTDDHLAVVVEGVSSSRVLLFDRVDLTLSYEYVLLSKGASLKVHSSLMVVGERLGRLGLLHLSTQSQMMFASDPRQATVISLDCDMFKTVVSSDDKIMV